jgi:D-glycerate 3-kinase
MHAKWIGIYLQQERLPESYRATIDDALVPLATAIAQRTRQSDQLVTVGLCGSQGSGKSTATAVLCELLRHDGLPASALSLDDFYLPRAQREELARTVHPLLRTRGVPGTHDVELTQAVIDSLATPEPTPLPSFDKATDDRRPRHQWPLFDGPARVVILEGWCVGAAPQSAAALVEPVNALERDEDADGRWRGYVNDRLAGPYRALFDRLSPLVLLQAPSFEVVYGWRQAGHKLRSWRGGKRWLAGDFSGDCRFISHYEVHAASRRCLARGSSRLMRPARAMAALIMFRASAASLTATSPTCRAPGPCSARRSAAPAGW